VSRARAGAEPVCRRRNNDSGLPSHPAAKHKERMSGDRSCPLTVVIACHNEAGAIADVVRRCRAVCEPAAQLLVVDDGSADDTARIAEQAGAEVVRLSPNGGKGRALRAGFAASRGAWVATLDGDGQDLPEELPLLRAAAGPGIGLVIGSRFRGRLEPGAIRPINLAGNLGLTLLFDALYGRAISDSQAGFRLLDGDLARSLALRSSEYEIETEVLARVLRLGWRAVEVPVTRRPRASGVTDFRTIANGMRILGTMVRCRMDRVASCGLPAQPLDR